MLENKDIDEGILIKENQQLPFPTFYFDIVYADYVLEHLSNSYFVFSEIHRILKNNGVFIFRTPNLYHYVTLLSKLIPPKFHQKISNFVRGIDENTETFKTYYRCNTKSRITNIAKKVGFSKVEIQLIEAEPSYLLFSNVTFLIGVLYERIVNSSDYLSIFRSNIIGKLTK